MTLTIDTLDMSARDMVRHVKLTPNGGTAEIGHGIVTHLQLEDLLARGRYVVGGVTAPEILTGYRFATDVDRYLAATAIIARAVRHGSHHVGWWSHNGALYLDVVQLTDDLDQALELARGRGEMAIWDARESAEIAVAS